MAETRKAYDRRVREGFFDKYIGSGFGIDIGCGRIDTHDGADPLVLENCIHHDKDDCDAHDMAKYPDNNFDWVYASHVLEHLNDPLTAIKNWFRILRPGGYLIISVPHRDLYEKKKLLKSKWNEDHKYFILPEKNEPPCTFSFKDMIHTALEIKKYPQPAEDVISIPLYRIEKFKVESSGFTITDPDLHSDGEISIEAIIQKL